MTTPDWPERKQFVAETAARVLQGFCANPAVFAANERCGWTLVNCTDADLAVYCVRLADELHKALAQCPALPKEAT